MIPHMAWLLIVSSDGLKSDLFSKTKSFISLDFGYHITRRVEVFQTGLPGLNSIPFRLDCDDILDFFLSACSGFLLLLFSFFVRIAVDTRALNAAMSFTLLY
jgi:hypothetical protein